MNFCFDLKFLIELYNTLFRSKSLNIMGVFHIKNSDKINIWNQIISIVIQLNNIDKMLVVLARLANKNIVLMLIHRLD